MSKIYYALLFNLFLSHSVSAVELVQVPIVCGSTEEVNALLALKMDASTLVAEGANQNGQHVAALFASANHWALVTRFTNERVCVVASGRTWKNASKKPDVPS